LDPGAAVASVTAVGGTIGCVSHYDSS